MSSPTVGEMLAATVARSGERLALVDGEQRWTWAELAGEVRRVAGGLQRRGIAAGDGVAIVLPNGHAFVTTFLAGQLLGAMAVPLNPLFTPEELAQHLSIHDVALVVGDPALVAELAAGDPIAVDVPPVAGDAPALLAFSSGSTGTPKGMIRSNANLVAEAEQFAATVDLTEDDVILAVVALFHAHGLGNGLLAAVHAGAALVVGPFERDATLHAIERHRVTLFPAVPFIFHTLAETRRAAGVDVGSLRLCFSAGAPLSQETFDLFLERFGQPIRQLYGCSEAGSVTINLDADAKGTWESVGRPMRGIELGVLDDDGARHDRSATGEVVFRSAALTSGYVGADPAAEESPFSGGWFRTADLGRLDEHGNLTITGRTKLFISTSGFKVDPFEVEAVLRDSPGVADVVVVGTGGERGEEVVKAVVVPAPDADHDQLRTELLAACRGRLAPFKVPRIVEFRHEIPRSPLGKILRKYLL